MKQSPHLSAGISRRQFLKRTALTAAVIVAGTKPEHSFGGSPRRKAAGEALNIALVGTAGRATNTIRDFLQLKENVVALCDVDLTRLASGAKLASTRFPKARQYQDYRKLFDKEKDLDAVVVTTPDHMHAPISLLAMAHGLHVFCEKPLTRTVWEARRMRDMARQRGVVTQMGTQGSASNSVRRAVEIIRAGVLGAIHEVHIWCDRKPVLARSDGHDEVPAGLDWDVWLGVAPVRPYAGNKRYHPHNWRWWTQFGTGPLGDMGCHLTNIAFRALDLAAPAEIDVEVSDTLASGMFPRQAKVLYRFPEQQGRKALTLTWYDGGRLPDRQMLEACGVSKQFGEVPKSEKLIIGDKGVLYGDGYVKLNGEDRFLGILKHEACKAVPETIARAKEQGTRGHYGEWVDACKRIGSTYAGFDIAAAQTEMVLLGDVAVQLGRKIVWDAENLRVPGEPSADALLRPVYRSGFTIS